MSDKPLILYHGGGCSDGFCAAWVASLKYPDAEFVAVNYGEPSPEVAGREVVILDFSYRRDVILAMAKSAKSITVRDHHATAEKELANLPPVGNLDVVFDMNKSGAMLAWELFYPGEKPPLIVEYVQDRDLWRHELEHSREVNAALRSYPFDFVRWSVLADRIDVRFYRFVEEGVAILRAESQVVYNHVKNATLVEIAGYKVPCVNATTLISEICGKLAEGMPFGCSYFDKAGVGTVYSLRSREGGIDVSEIAKQFGGGGHRCSSGFQREAGFRFPRVAS